MLGDIGEIDEGQVREKGEKGENNGRIIKVDVKGEYDGNSMKGVRAGKNGRLERRLEGVK